MPELSLLIPDLVESPMVAWGFMGHKVPSQKPSFQHCLLLMTCNPTLPITESRHSAYTDGIFSKVSYEHTLQHIQ